MLENHFSSEASVLFDQQEGKIRRFKKNTQNDGILNEFAQNHDLSYEARGLLISLSTYPDSVKLFKSELYCRSQKNKRSSIERMWEELIQAGYILQFRKRVGKKYIFNYLFELSPYSSKDIIALLEVAEQYQYKLYHKTIRHAENQSIDKYKAVLPKYLTASELEEVLDWMKKNYLGKITEMSSGHDYWQDTDLGFGNDRRQEINVASDVEKPHLKIDNQTDVNWEVGFQQLKSDSANSQDSKEPLNTFEIGSGNIEKEEAHSSNFLRRKVSQHFPEVSAQTFLDKPTVSLLALFSKSEKEMLEYISILFQAKKSVEKSLGNYTIVDENHKTDTYLMVRQFFTKLKMNNDQFVPDDLTTYAKRHWMNMAELELFASEDSSAKEPYREKLHEMNEELQNSH